MIQAQRALAEDIARELGVRVAQVNATIDLLDNGASVPFIARYRKEATAGLTDTQLRSIAQRVDYLRELDARREVIAQQLTDANQLTAELSHALMTAATKTQLEDLYLPFRPKRRTKASLAIEAGCLPVAELLLLHPEQVSEQSEAALDGARQILMERFAENAPLIAHLRDYLWDKGVLKSEAVKNPKANKQQKANATKFNDYLHYAEAIKKIPSHRALALFRGRREQAIQFHLTLPDPEYGVQAIVSAFNLDQNSTWLMETARLTWKNRLLRSLETELFARLRELADEEAIRVFSRNLRALLLVAPAGRVVTMGLDPGFRAGIKIAVVDGMGTHLDDTTVFPFAPDNAREEAITALAKLMAKYHVQHVSIGNGTGSREATQLVADCLKRYPDMTAKPIVVNEAGASVYSASSLAANELPDLDVTLRGAVSIARRLQDPLAELVKIEPQAIGVGQYQHDVNPSRLSQRLRAVVEDCVNAVGVDVNTASIELLTYVSGLNDALARQIVLHRETHGPFRNRQQLLDVARMGEKTFQQAAGFLRIAAGDNPLDCSAVHPEAYTLVDKILAHKACTLDELLGNQAVLNELDAAVFTDGSFGLPTVQDVLSELAKPGRDPRVEFSMPRFKDGVDDIKHLTLGMILEGVVSNVTNFGAFVDIGVHQDGLVHISAMRERFIRDPHQVLKVGDIVQVKVIEIDTERRRIGLSMRLTEEAESKPKPKSKPTPTPKSKLKPQPKPIPKQPKIVAVPFNTVMADAFAKLKQGK
jgi:uncharacterized protein